MGTSGGLAHLLAVASGQTYNRWFKFTILSWLPYALSFALLPTAILLGAGSADPWRLAPVGALLGIAAHLTNVVGDIDGDLRTGVHGFPQRIGARPSTYLAIALLVIVAILLFSDLRLIVALTVAATSLALLPPRRPLFVGLMALAALDVVLLLGSLHS
ncbi:MAG TPA: hypothetical protein DDY88_05795 [Actinobacteria bacterium]|nr:hypothetical protein [Actinomycetota bacterium]